MKVEGIDKVDPVYYTVAHGDGYSRERAIVVVGRGRGTAEVARPSVLHAAECAARRARLRSVCRRPVPRVLRAGHGPTELGAWPVFSAATGGLLRGHRFGTRDRVARDRLVGGAQLSAARPGGRPARSFDDRADAAPDRCRDAPRHLHVGATTTRRGGIAQGEDRGDRCHHARGERRDAQHRAARHRRELSGVSDRARHGLGDRDPDARGPGTGGQEAQEEDVEHGVDQPARPPMRRSRR